MGWGDYFLLIAEQPAMVVIFMASVGASVSLRFTVS
jgi:hypothetical protein